MVIFRSQKKPASKKFWKTLFEAANKGWKLKRIMRQESNRNVLCYCDVFITQGNNKKCKNVNSF